MSGSFGRLTKARKSSSSRTSIDSGSPSLSSTPPASPPTRLLRGNDAALAAAASNNNPPALSVEFPRGTSFSRLGGGAGSSSGGGPPTVQSNSSMDSGSNSTGLYDSPSSTPPKKTWERNYKSFLKKSVGGGGGNNKHHVMPTPSMLPAPRMPHATTVIGGHHKRSSAPMLATAGLFNNDDVEVQRIMNFSSDAFATNSNDDEWASNPTITKSASSSPVRPSTGGSSGSTKEHSSRGGAFFRKLRSKTKSEDSIVDSLDSTMRRGVDRRSPTTTPPGSVTSTPQKHSPTSARKVSTIQDGLEKAAILSEKLGTPVLQHDFAPPFIPSQTTTMQQQPVKEHSNNSNRKHKAAKKAMKKLSRGNSMDQGNDNLDQAMHHGQGTFVAPSNKSKVAALKVTPLSRVKSMSSNLTIKEGVPSVISSEQEALMREKRKAFTDFHNQGVDSTSAFLGDESSLHRNSVFLSSMAYPAKASAPPSSTMHGGVAQSYDKRTTISPSTSENAIKSKGDQSSDLGDAGDVTPERALRPVKGPESWKKGERHSIIPAILCMCPFQVLSRIMSDDGGNHLSGQPMLSASMTSTSSGYGIGSIISEDDHNDSNQSGWFFADHNHPQPTNHRRSISAGVQPSAFGKIMLGKATVAALGVRSFFNEIYGWSSGVFVLRQNYLFEYRDNDNLNGLPWGYAHLQLAEAYPHKHFTNALHLDFFEKPCVKSGKRSLLMRVEDKGERDRWVSLLQAAARTTIHDLYDVDVNGGPECGRGRYAVVRPAKRRQNRRQLSSNEGLRLVSSGDNLTNHDQAESSSTEYDCALKIVNKKEFWSRVKKGAERADTLVREAAVQTTLAVQGADTPGFLRLRSIFETGEELVFELELLKGIDLFQHVSSRGTLDEMEAALIMRDLLHCLDVMDQIGIAHRDIKPANLLMCNENCSRCKIKMADFGMASFVGVDNLVRGRCGTPGFVAPEILRTAVNSGYGNKVDVFSAGVTLYVMLAGYEPFYGESDAELVTANREAKVDFPHADWHKISVEGRDLVEKMLIADPSERISPAGALRHPWITRRAAINTGCGDEYEVQVKF